MRDSGVSSWLGQGDGPLENTGTISTFSRSALNPLENTMARETARDLFIVGLRNAHSMEVQARELMERQSERTSDFPAVQQRLKQHLHESREHIRRIEDCLRQCGESESTIKDTALSMLGNLAAMAHASAGDEILKNTFANNAFEHYEVAAYKSLIKLCERAGASCSNLLEANLREDQEMADWVDSHVEDVTLQYLAKEEREAA
jgi:ferritin-like metal-binding protein YciE